MESSKNFEDPRIIWKDFLRIFDNVEDCIVNLESVPSMILSLKKIEHFLGQFSVAWP